ncbi:AEC family transporter [Petrocella sp. FN5]|uniref:AEC family transporter n=1 Tax=Petrocella sp. FN5 TaxID=3032002 RepID=UPI0023DAEB6A|nr:AEC family transporter [Petrocella sp. FN5]MDF1616761.1 AEC family transporter [Petrocella sp. FN5]
MLENFIFSLTSAIPIFMVMIVGYYLKKRKLVDENFVKMANKLVFNVALPIKLFSDVFKTSLNQYLDLKFIIFILTGTVLSVVLVWILVQGFIKDKAKLGAFLHGSFRGNFLYIGLSLMENVTGSIGLKAPLAIAFIIPTYNILAVIILTLTCSHKDLSKNTWGVIKNIIKNPLIIAVLVGILASRIELTLPLVASRTMGYFEVLATPLALITIGASFSFEKLTANLKVSLLASLFKLVIIPAFAVAAALMIGFSNEDILLIYIIFGVPTATVSYIMTVAMYGDRDLSSNIIMTSTILSNVTMTLFIFAFKTMGIL